ncbi:hypothetical protein WJX73_010385 [Symbiochloris irregularis]|uniref:RRM domain-containing protein n=1 Tax=Symbiochloris irregularis TaxID=706552 RepID=A0AAW1PF77_9CHLO
MQTGGSAAGDDDLYGDIAQAEAAPTIQAAQDRAKPSAPQPEASTSGRQASPQGTPTTEKAPGSGKPAAATGPASLYLGNLQWWTSDAELEALCAEYGTLSSLKIFEDRKNGKSQGYALVEFSSPAAARACKEGLHGRSIQDKNCVVTFANNASASAAAASAAAASTAKEATTTAVPSTSGRGQGQYEAGRGRSAPYSRGRGPAQQQRYDGDSGGFNHQGGPGRYPSTHGHMGGMPMPPGMAMMPDVMMGGPMMGGPMMPMGPIIPANMAGMPMPGMMFGHQDDQFWGVDQQMPYKRQRFY